MQEKNLFEWDTGGLDDAPGAGHTRDAIYANRWIADFFVNEARKVNAMWNAERSKLIYAAHTVDTLPLNSSFEQCYLFP